MDTIYGVLRDSVPSMEMFNQLSLVVEVSLVHCSSRLVGNLVAKISEFLGPVLTFSRCLSIFSRPQLVAAVALGFACKGRYRVGTLRGLKWI